LGGLALDILDLEKQGFSPDTEGWLDDLMETPELSLAEFAESAPNLRLAVVDTTPFDALEHFNEVCRVVKMEEK
jgi:hypothetical protein